jgi:PmbA/TldA metallopeptidase domain 1
MLTRRTFLNTSAAALREAKKLKASYCDIRIIRTRQQFLNIRLNPERGTGKTLEVPGVGDGGSFGFGVRVIVDGAWGFAASPSSNPRESRASPPRPSRSPKPTPRLLPFFSHALSPCHALYSRP